MMSADQASLTYLGITSSVEEVVQEEHGSCDSSHLRNLISL
jgi:hypothetical protein